jgi:hypothetical protein
MCSEYLDGSNRTQNNGKIFLSQKTREQTHPQGICEYTSAQCDFIVHRQELAQKIQIRRSFLQRRRTAWKASDFFGPGFSALSEEVSLRECSSNGMTFLAGSGYHQAHS